MGKRTTIQLSKTARDKLAECGKKDDTFEDIILKLIEYYEQD